MNRADVASSLVALALGAGVIHAGLDLELGSPGDPGSGFMLFWVGVAMVGLSAIVLVNGVRGPAPSRPLWRGARWSKIVAVVAALVAYAWLLERLGFVLTTVLLLVFLFKVVEPQRWWVALTGAVASALIAYVVFKMWLGAQLPAGVPGIG